MENRLLSIVRKNNCILCFDRTSHYILSVISTLCSKISIEYIQNWERPNMIVQEFRTPSRSISSPSKPQTPFPYVSHGCLDPRPHVSVYFVDVEVPDPVYVPTLPTVTKGEPSFILHVVVEEENPQKTSSYRNQWNHHSIRSQETSCLLTPLWVVH